MKIGILTMHRVVNYGSALQAYALQRFLSAQGYDNEIKVQKHFKGRKCVFLDGRIKDRRRADSAVAGNLSPYDFLNLVENAGFVVTTSFHGTAFAINFRKPFYSVVHPDTGRDDRMASLLRRVGLGHRAIRYDRDFVFEPMSYGREVEEHIAGFIGESKAFISGALS